MAIGVVQYVLGGRHLGDKGLHPVPAASPQAEAALRSKAALWGGLFVAVLAVIGIGGYTGALPITAVGVADAAGVGLLLSTVIFFAWLLTSSEWTPAERKRLVVIAVLFLAAALFWSVFEQAGSTLNLFADRATRTELLGLSFPSSWFQSVNSFFIFTLAPVFAWLWVKLAARGQEPSSPGKFVFGLVCVGLGFLILMGPASASAGGDKVSPLWLVLTYLLHTIGELSLSPGGPERDDAAGAGADCRTGDGRVVPGHVRRQLHRRPRVGLLRIDGACRRSSARSAALPSWRR